MISGAKTVDEYLNSLPGDRKQTMEKLVTVVRKNLPAGFSEGMGYGMIGWVVPHTLFPAGYHCDPDKPVPFINIASQKAHIGFYHMGLYGSNELTKWFLAEWPKYSKKKPDMGKACIRFKKEEDIPFELLGELCRRMTPLQWLEIYQASLQSSRKK